jgi:hypothetical protein
MTGRVDLTDLDLWARGVPHAEFARLRREAPVAWFDEAPPNSGFWSVHCYEDIVATSRDVARFSSARGISFEEPTDEEMTARRTIIDTDLPEHTKLRKIVSGAFSVRAVAVYQHFVAGLTEQVLDAAFTGPVLAGSELDFVDRVAKEVPIRVRVGSTFGGFALVVVYLLMSVGSLRSFATSQRRASLIVSAVLGTLITAGAIFGSFYKVTSPTIWAPWLALALLAVGFISTFALRAREPASTQLADLSAKSSV